MPQLTKALPAGLAAALVGGFACLGTATASADPTPANILTAALSKGYNASNCSPAQVDGALAAFDCGQNGDDNGPASARYVLLGNPNDLAGAFTTSVGAMTQTNCGDVKSPTVWRQSNTADPSGQVACGTFEGQSEVLWSTNARSVISLIRGSNGDVAALYNWWRTMG
jgi:hypothetical protein